MKNIQFTNAELNLIESALLFYEERKREEYEQKKAKGRKNADFSFNTMKRASDLQSKIFQFKLENGLCI